MEKNIVIYFLTVNMYLTSKFCIFFSYFEWSMYIIYNFLNRSIKQFGMVEKEMFKRMFSQPKGITDEGRRKNFKSNIETFRFVDILF